MAAQRLWVTGLSWLLVGCNGSDGISPPLPPCTSGTPLALSIGAYQSIDPGRVSGCIVFPATASATEYLLVPQSATGTPNDSQSFQLVGSDLTPSTMASLVAAPEAAPTAVGPAERFHLFLRQAERSRAYPVPPQPQRAGGVQQAVQAAAQASPPPRRPFTPADSGVINSFKVCSDVRCRTSHTVDAALMKIGQHIAIYVDTAAPTPGLSQSDLDALRAVFDTRLYQIDTTAFGRESDIDHNGVVIVLMTNGVNELVKAADCSSGVVAGYFYGADIDPFWGPQFNNGEIFYALVPDPVPTLQSCAHTVAEVKRLVPVTFIHEFQHMISYNHHVLERHGDAEILWLNESLSHYAEELGGRSVLPADTATFCSFVAGDLSNSGTYLQSPQSHFLVDTAGIGDLANRGAYWLFLRYLIDQYSADTSFAQRAVFTRKLDITSLTGPQNVATQTGQSFALVLERWALANWVSDLPGFTAPSELRYKMWRFRADYPLLRNRCPDPGTGVPPHRAIPAAFTLVPGVGAGSAVNLSGVLRAGSGTYLRVQQAAGETGFGLLFSNGSGGRLGGSLVGPLFHFPVAFNRLNVIRIQ